jgi:hypothetical protein
MTKEELEHKLEPHVERYLMEKGIDECQWGVNNDDPDHLYITMTYVKDGRVMATRLNVTRTRPGEGHG